MYVIYACIYVCMTVLQQGEKNKMSLFYNVYCRNKEPEQYCLSSLGL